MTEDWITVNLKSCFSLAFNADAPSCLCVLLRSMSNWGKQLDC